MKGLLLSCFLFALAAICFAGDSSTAVTTAIKNGKPTRVLADGCDFKLLVPKRCTFKLQQFPNSTEEDCGFPKLGLKVLLQETVNFAISCPKGLSVTNMVKGDEEVDWEFKFYKNGATGHLKELKFDDILTPAIKKAASLVGLKLNDLHVPGSVRNATVFAAFEKETKDIWVGLGGTDGTCAAHVVAIVKKNSTNQDKLGGALGVTCPNEKLNSFLDRFGGGGLNLDFLEKAQYSVILSSTDIRGATGRFFFNKAKQLMYMQNTTAGVNVVATVGRPTECKSHFCEFLRSILQTDSQLKIHGAVRSKTDLKLTAALPFNIKISNNARLKDINLKVETQPVDLALRVSVEIQKPKLLLSGGIKGGQSGVGLEAYMGGVWDRAFGLSHVGFGDVIMSVTFAPPEPVPTAFQLGGRLLLGRKPNTNAEVDKRLQARAYIGLDTATPTENYFYAHVNMTVEKLLDAFDIKADIPHVIEESGFPDGMLASYTSLPNGKALKEINLEIPHGLHINGTMDILGLVSTCDVHINFKLSDVLVFMNITLPVVRLGGIASFRAAKNQNIGAHALVSFTAEDPKGTKVVFEGYLELFGMSRHASMYVNSSAIEVTTGGGLFHFNAEMFVRAQYGSIEKANFTVGASITNDRNMEKAITSPEMIIIPISRTIICKAILIEFWNGTDIGYRIHPGHSHSAVDHQLAATLKKELLKKLAEGKQKLQEAQDTLEEAKANCERLLTLKCNDCDGAQNTICNYLVIKPCKLACKIFVSNSRSCNRKCDLVGRNCKTDLNKACTGSCDALTVVGHGLCQNVEVALGTVALTEKTYGGIIKVSIKALDALEIFNLRSLRFETGLSAGAIAEFDSELDVVVLKKHFHMQHKLNLELLSKGDKKAIGEFFHNIYEEVKDKFH